MFLEMASFPCCDGILLQKFTFYVVNFKTDYTQADFPLGALWNFVTVYLCLVAHMTPQV
jgi:hypothetical protein